MTDINSIPDHGAQLVDEDGRARNALQRYFDDITILFNANRSGLKDYTVATVPAASVGYGLIMVTDEVGGAVPAFSDLTNWRRVTDRAVVS